MSWPYGDPPEPLQKTDGPSWKCPEEKCQCHPIDEPSGEHELSIVLLAKDGSRMPGARCRVHHQGRVINEDAPNADGDGRVKVVLPRAPATLLVEWAPSNTPEEPEYPYRSRYFADLTEDEEQSGRRRLANLGFRTERSLEGNVRAFQRRYTPGVDTGELADIAPQLVTYHDLGCPPITHDPEPGEVRAKSIDKGDANGKGDAFSLAPRNAKQLGDDPKPDAGAPPTPQTPVSPQPNQGSVKVPSPKVEVDLLIDWGRGKAGGGGQPSKSFLVNPENLPVFVAVTDYSPGGWATDKPKRYVEINRKSGTTALATLPVGIVDIRIDFDLQISIDEFTRTVLNLQQNFLLLDDGTLLPTDFAFDDYTLEKAPVFPDPPGTPLSTEPQGRPPVRGDGQGTNVNAKKRLGRGLHPLLSLGGDINPPDPAKKGPKPKDAVPRLTKRVFINCEFVDATELFWDIHTKVDAERYLHPALAARAEHLRVLAWTTGDLPLYWFAAVPDAALRSLDGGADIVFFRPPPEANSFTHKADLKGFKDERHHLGKDGKVSTLWMLARFLVAPQALAALRGAIGDTTLHDPFCWQIQPTVPRNPDGKISPATPAPFISEFDPSFRACGMEAAVNATGAPHILFFPLASENDGYPGAMRRGLKSLIQNAVLCLWNSCAVARDLPARTFDTILDGAEEHPQSPAVAARSLWLCGHSAGNFSLGACLSANGADVERVMSFSATEFKGTIDNVITNLTVAADARKKAGKTIDAFVVTSPDVTKPASWDITSAPQGSDAGPTVRGVSMPVQYARRYIATGAAITFLPPFDDQKMHYTIRPALSMTPVVSSLVSAWTLAERDASSTTGAGWAFLFFHEYPVVGGDGSPASGKSFFAQSLGPPMPLTTPPKDLPP